VGFGGLSNHSPISLEFACVDCKPKGPYKFNSTWLNDEGYMKMVIDYWKARPLTLGQSIYEAFAKSMLHLKQKATVHSHYGEILDKGYILITLIGQGKKIQG